MKIEVEQDLFSKEAELAEINRAIFRERGLCALNLLAGPGAGKTSLIKAIAAMVDFPVAVIEGDPASQIDTDLLNSLGIPAFQINTEGGCHLEAEMVTRALAEFRPAPHSLLVIENVGNLICTAVYPLGEVLRVVMLGVSEGDDKPFKYPDIFQEADAVVLNKMDLAAHVDFDKNRFYDGVRRLSESVPVFELSCKSGEGLPEWTAWLTQRAAEYWTGA
jgi:hydrogenase nickel incorporation protein HypB